MNFSFKKLCLYTYKSMDIEIMFLFQVPADISVDNISIWFNSVYWSNFHKVAVPIKQKYRR